MKISDFLLLFFVAYTNAIEEDELVQKWKEFQVDFGKSYRSPVEAQKRLNNFKQNLQDINTHNSMYEKGLVPYKKGINQFADWTKDEFMQFVNKGLGSEQIPVGKLFKEIEDKKVPTCFDWRKSVVLTPVKNQGNCQGCWSFSATGAIEAHLAISTGKLISLSEQNLIDCSREQGNAGCLGGWMHQAFEYVQTNGIESEADYPFLATNSRCKADSSKIVTKIKDYVQIPQGDEKTLTSALGLCGPVSVAIVSTTNLQLYSEGILVDNLCSGQPLNHGVLAVGYGSEDGVDYYIIRNSWGPTWGESGYFRLARNQKNMCGIATVAHFPEIDGSKLSNISLQLSSQCSGGTSAFSLNNSSLLIRKFLIIFLLLKLII